jgi:hypothetical protein
MKRGLLTSLLTAVAMLAVACGGGSSKSSGNKTTVNAQAKFQDAVSGTTQLKEGTLTFSVAGAQHDLDLLLGSSGGTAHDRALAEKLLLESTITIGVQGAKASGRGTLFSIDAKLSDVDHALQLRYVDKKLYVRADVMGIAKLAGADTTKLQENVTKASQAGLGFLQDAVAGKWIALDLSGLKDTLGKLLPGFPPTTTAGEVAQLRSALLTDIAQNVVTTKVGSDSVGDHYRHEVHLRPFVSALATSLQSLAGSALQAAQFSPDKVPDQTIVVDTWLKSSKLARVEFDLAQLKPEAHAGRVALRIDVSDKAPSIEAPAGATTVDLGKIFSTFLGGLGGGASGAQPFSTPASSVP